MIKSFLAAVLLPVSVVRCFVSRMQDFYTINYLFCIMSLKGTTLKELNFSKMVQMQLSMFCFVAWSVIETSVNRNQCRQQAPALSKKNIKEMAFRICHPFIGFVNFSLSFISSLIVSPLTLHNTFWSNTIWLVLVPFCYWQG